MTNVEIIEERIIELVKLLKASVGPRHTQNLKDLLRTNHRLLNLVSEKPCKCAVCESYPSCGNAFLEYDDCKKM